MDVGGISEQKRASFAEVLCDTMMNLVRGKPVHSIDADWHPSHHARIDVVPCQRLALSKGLIRMRAVATSDRPRRLTRTPKRANQRGRFG
jgi:hypothetical protein